LLITGDFHYNASGFQLIARFTHIDADLSRKDFPTAMKRRHSPKVLFFVVLLLVIALVAGCQPVAPIASDDGLAAVATATQVAEEVAIETPIAGEATPTEEATPEAVVEAQPGPVGNPPVEIEIPALSLVIPVTPMGWESTEVDGQITTRWVVPDDAAGWAPNSARAGNVGNVVIAGHQARGAAVFAAVALGEVEVGQELVLADETGNTFTYRVVEVSEPIPVLGATDAEVEQAAVYAAPTTDARLTLITGWPAATTTHRVFVVAELVASAQ
jgi:LPXTG-site transpeptidase (sortase) family protein